MYTPGPANLLSLNAGLKGQMSCALRFCLGVSCAMLLLFLLFSFSGSWVVGSKYQVYISAAGSLYIAYLAIKIASSRMAPVVVDEDETAPVEDGKLGFKSGLVLQVLNPKSFVAILPIVTVQFPAAHIYGGSIIVWSLLLSIFAFGAPACYLAIGARLGNLLHHPRYLMGFNLCMALLLLYVAADIAYSHVYIKW
jgi:threonine/homoserine/homoserine lactone efflux protein